MSADRHNDQSVGSAFTGHERRSDLLVPCGKQARFQQKAPFGHGLGAAPPRRDCRRISTAALEGLLESVSLPGALFEFQVHTDQLCD